ncbi:MAG: RsmE family RNA methyltransferase [bacterium]
MPQFVITSSSIKDGLVAVEGKDFKHVKSLRISLNDEVVLLDEKAYQYIARLEKITKQKAIFRILNQFSSSHEPSGIILAQAIIKPHRMQLAIQKATELGVDEIIPFISQYTVVKINQEHFMDRYKKIIKEAVNQSMRAYIPKLHSPITFDKLITTIPESKKILFHYDPSAKPIQEFTETLKDNTPVTLIIGPEGGFSSEEIKYATQYNAVVASLGLNILRSETAAISAISITSFIRGLK